MGIEKVTGGSDVREPDPTLTAQDRRTDPWGCGSEANTTGRSNVGRPGGQEQGGGSGTGVGRPGWKMVSFGP